MKNKKLTWKDAAGLITLVLFIIGFSYLLYSIPPFERFCQERPVLAKFVFFLLLLVVISPVVFIISYLKNRCPKCHTRKVGLKICYGTGIIECPQCGHKRNLEEVFDEEDILYMLEAALKSKDLTSEDKEKVEKLLKKYAND